MKINWHWLRQIISVSTGSIIAFLFTILSSPVLSLSLNEAYQLALQDDPKLQSAFSSQKAEAELLKQRKSYLLPDIAFEAEKGYRNTAPDVGNASTYDNYGITLSMPLVNKELWKNIEAEELTLDKSELQLEYEKQAVVERVTLAYIGVLEANVKLDAAIEITNASKRRLDQVQDTFDQRLATSADLIESNAAYDLASAREVLARGDAETSWEALYRVTGLEEPTNLKQLDMEYPILALQPASPSYWVDKALNNNFNLRLAKFDLDIADQQILSAQARYEPTIALVASYEHINDDLRVSEKVGRSSVSLTFDLPLYQGGSFDSAIKEYQHRRNASMGTFDDGRREIKQQVRTLVQRLNNSVVFVLALKQSVVSAKAALIENENNYRVGRRSIEDVLTAERRVHETKRDYLLARYGYVRNLVSLQGLLGGLSSDYATRLDLWLSFEEGNNQS